MGNTYCDFAPGHPWHGPYHDREYGFPIADDDALLLTDTAMLRRARARVERG